MSSEQPQGWLEVELPDVVDIAYGKNLPTKKLKDEGYPVYGANGQIGFYDEYNCEHSEVLITCRGATCGTINMSAPKSFVTNNSMVLKPHDTDIIGREYLRLAMLATDKSKVITGTAQPQITIANLSKHRIGLAPLSEQRRIVAKIEELTARSRNAKQALDAIPPLLERFRQSVLAAAFRGDLTKQWRQQNPNTEPASELLKRIRQERRHRWEHDYLQTQKAKGKQPKNDKWKEKYKEPESVDTTDLPDLPEGWCWTTVRHLVTYQSGATYKSKDFIDSGIQVIRLGNLYKGNFDTARDPVFLPDEAVDHSARIGPGVILVSQTGTRHKRDYGYFVVVPPDAPDMALNQRVLALRAVGEIPPEFLSYVAMLPVYREHFFSQETGGVNQGNVGLSGVLEGPVPLPPLSELFQILQSVDEALSSVKVCENGRAHGRSRLERLEQSILAKAFRGELVPQDPNDEPATVLLERICAEREADPRKARRKSKAGSRTA